MEGTLTHSLTCRSHTQSRGHTHSHLPLSHRVEGTLILTSKLKRRMESTLTPTLSLSLSHTMEELSLSLSHSLSPMNTLTLLHTQEGALTNLPFSHTHRGEHTHSTLPRQDSRAHSLQLFSTQIGWHTHSHIHPLKTSHSHILTNRPLSRIEWRPRSLLPPRR